jgi:hypothetical protein
LSINVEETKTTGALFWKSEKTETKQQSAEEFLIFQREHLFDKGEKSNTYNIDGGTRTYNDAESINQSLFEYADKDKNGTIDDSEYKSFIAESIFDGTVGAKTYALVNGINDKGLLSTNDSTIITADYAKLTQLLDLYNNITEADKGIDGNKDGVLTKEEFFNSAALTLTTNQDKNLIQQLFSDNSSLSYNEKYEIASSVSNGTIGDIFNKDDFKYVLNHANGEYEMCHVPVQDITPNYSQFIEAAEKYSEKINQE